MWLVRATSPKTLDALSVWCRGVRVSFFGTTLGPLAEPDLTIDGVALVASAVDVLAYKLETILQRAEAKDHYDIAALLTAVVSVESGLVGARRLFGKVFQPAEACRSLCCFDDVSELSNKVRSQLTSAEARVKRS